MSGSEIDWQQVAIWIGMGMGGAGGGLWATLRKPKQETGQPQGTAQVLMASFTDRTQHAQLIDVLVRLCELLEADVHRRELEAEVRQQLARRGTEK